MRSAFEQQLAGLNAAQTQAVETVEGPVMVVAGPGTGKTQVLALRTANILRRTQARPSNILCLTFSTAGATAMRERLRSFIGGDAYGVTVDTVHGFCDGVIRRYGTAFEDWNLKKPISDLERYKLLRSLIDRTADAPELINPKNPYARIPDILSRISDCKREGKSIEQLHAVAQEYEMQMQGKSKEGTKAHKENCRKAKAFKSFVRIAQQYAEALDERSLYDYDDMILTVIDALKREEWLRASLQERYQYIQVDEAQDLNGAQWEVIHTLTTYDVLPHDPNIFIVGDDDQSIYRFQGANVAQMLAFIERYPAAPVVVLTENYRSTQSILDAAGRLIARNDERLVGRVHGLSKDLVSMTGAKTAPEPLLLRSASDAAEPWLIADLCEEQMRSGVSASEIAVLVQTNAELFPLYDVLRARGIPVVMQGKSDLFSQNLVRQTLTILRCVTDTSTDAFLHAAGAECFGVHASDLSRVVQKAKADKRSRMDVLLSLEQETTVQFADVDTLIRTRDILLDLRSKEHSRTVLQTVEQVLRTCGLLPQDDNADPIELAAIESLFQYVKAYCLEHPAVTLSAFLKDAGYYADPSLSHLRLTFQVPHLIREGVQLLTAHQSKGLEFSCVILSQFREGHWDERKRVTGLFIPEDLLFGWDKDTKKLEKKEDERRVAYVAMTRAKRDLIFVCPREFAVGERARAVAPSIFFAEAGPLPEEDRELSEPEKASVLLLRPQRDLGAEEEAYLRFRLEHFALSASSLSRFLHDPQEFKRVHLLGLPEELTEESQRALGYGNAVHAALHAWALARMHQRMFTEEDFIAAFEEHLLHHTILTDMQRRDLLQLGKEALALFFQENLAASTAHLAAVERSYSATVASGNAADDRGIPIKGTIDRIDRISPESSDIIVIDYKTGRQKAPAEIRGGIDKGRVSRDGRIGANFRQLVFYALLLEQKEPMLRPVSLCLQFIGERGQESILRPFEVTEEEKDDLRSVLRAVWKKIVALDFTPLEQE